ncbi:MAG TPA: hypothetical protein VGD60_00745 [Candidatus Acidoferrales bacterium]
MSSTAFNTGAISDPFIFVPASDNFLSWTVAQGSDGVTPVTDCTGTATLLDEYGESVPGATAVAMSTTGGGVYKCTFPNGTFNPAPGRNYRLKIQLASSSLGATRTWWADAWVAEEQIA